MRAQIFCAFIGLLLVGGVFVLPSFSGHSPESQIATAPSFGSAEQLETAFTKWASDYEAEGGKQILKLPLGYSKGLSERFTDATGRAEFDIASGAVSITVKGLTEARALEAWIVDNRPGPGRSVRPETGDRTHSLGRFERASDGWTLHTDLMSLAEHDFRIDLVVVGEQGTSPQDAGLLFGAPSLFQKLYYARLAQGLFPLGEIELPEDQAAAESKTPFGSFGFLVARPAYAQVAGAALRRLIRQGEDLFLNETFEGNGRTCATCHPPANNFTIDPLFIATLPDDDPLFIAEFDPNLAVNFENPALMREFGLILENTNGFGDLANNFTMRGTPHTLALPTSIDGPGGQPRLGWSGDGAPPPGTLRLFAVGAVTQHFPKTLARQPGVDFVFPSDAELDAMAAFQLSLGRQDELSLPLALTGTVASQGQDIFLDNSVSRCNLCHLNAGANEGFSGSNFNFNFDTGVESMADAPALLTGELVPMDDGFGNPGDGTFNTPTLVEAADTGPFFHNHSVETIEGAVAFYNSDAFNNSPSAAIIGSINMTTPEVVA
ncbi:MAG: hypothetical protein R3245_08030, partial [Kiloniellales bacterium]|nr:hypothetical protein [Kiloniellales bacterium]